MYVAVSGNWLSGTPGNCAVVFAAVCPSAAGKLIGELQINGYVTRVADPHDRRGFLVQATERGTAALACGAQVKDQLAGRAVDVLGAEALERLHRDLAALEDVFRDQVMR